MTRKKKNRPMEFWINASAIDMAVSDLEAMAPGYYRTDIPNLEIAEKFSPYFQRGFADLQIVEVLKKFNAGDPDRLVDLVESARSAYLESVGDAASPKLRHLDEEVAQIKARPSKAASKVKPESAKARSVASATAKADPASADGMTPIYDEESATNSDLPFGGAKQPTADELPDFAQEV